MTARASAWLTAGLIWALSVVAAAGAQDVLSVRALGPADVGAPGVQRLQLIWPDALGDAAIDPTVSVEHGVVVARLGRAVSFDVSQLPEMFPDTIALARLDADGRALRLALTGERTAAVSRSYNIVALDLSQPGASPPPPVDSPRAQAERLAAAQAARRAALVRKDPVTLPLNVRVAEAAEYTRVVFEWTEPVAYQTRQDGQTLTIAFDRDAAPRMTDLRVRSPRGVANAEADRSSGKLEVAFTLADGFGGRAWSDGARVVLDIADSALIGSSEADELAALAELGATLAADAAGSPLPTPSPSPRLAPAPEPEPQTPEAPEAPESGAEPEGSEAGQPDAEHDEADHAASDPAPTEHSEVEDSQAHGAAAVSARADPLPEDGRVAARVTPLGGAIHAAFRWNAPVAAAVFRRGDAAWVVFDAPAKLDLEELSRAGGRHVRAVEGWTGEGYAAARIDVPATTQVSVKADGARWIVMLSEAVDLPPEAIMLRREADGARAGRLVAKLRNVRALHAVPDPDAGDTLMVALADAPIQGLQGQRTFIDVTALQSAHGAAFSLTADGVTARLEPDQVIVESAAGLLLTPQVTAARSSAGAPSNPGFIDFAGWSGPKAAFTATHDALTRAAAVSEAPAEDYLALARFLVGHELGAEALAAVSATERIDPQYAKDARLRAISGAANASMGRLDAARADFNTPVLARDPAAALWRGWLAAQGRDWRQARREFGDGQDAMFLMRADWRARFLIAQADAAMALNDLAGAKAALGAAMAEEAPKGVLAQAQLSQARLAFRSDDLQAALEGARSVAASGHEPLEVAALRLESQAARALGLMSDEAARERMEELRFRWRGDETEFDIVRELGRIYVEQGDIRGGFQLMQAAVTRFPNTPAARETNTEMASIFRSLFLEGGAERLDPIQALALWYEFADMTPIGADGDYMIRRLADRLVAFDLLEQASDLLRHQVDNRLRGAAKAQVATDLAAIYLMDRRPGDALQVLASSRVARLDGALNAERRLLEARALAELGRGEHALELIARDSSPLARATRADIAWSLQDWTRAGPILEDAAGGAYRAEAALSPREESAVLRAALAYSLADEPDRLARLSARYDAKMRNSAQAAAWRVITSPGGADSVRVKDLARGLAAIDSLESFLDEFRANRAVQAPSGGGPSAGAGADMSDAPS